MAPEILKLAAEREAAENLTNDKKNKSKGGRGLFGLSAQAAAAAAARKNDELLDDATRQARFNAVCKVFLVIVFACVLEMSIGNYSVS